MDQVLVARVARSFILIVIQMGCTDTPEVTVIIFNVVHQYLASEGGVV